MAVGGASLIVGGVYLGGLFALLRWSEWFGAQTHVTGIGRYFLAGNFGGPMISSRTNSAGV